MSAENLSIEQVVQQKRAKWGQMGVAIFKTENALQLRAQQIEQALPAAEKIDDLPAAEAALKTAKQQLAQLIEDRLKVTNTLNDVVTRMMRPEKAIDTRLIAYAGSIIELKRKKEAADKLNQQKNDELKKIAERVRIYVADVNAAYLQDHAKLIKDSYVHALEKVSPENLAPFLEKVKARVNVGNRTMERPVFKAQYAEQAEVDAEIDKAFAPKPATAYIAGFVADIDLKYSDYKLAWGNKPQALEMNEKEASQNVAAIDQQKQQDVVAANIQAMASVPITGPVTTALKTVYKLAMDETFEHANIVIMAYLANAGRCRESMRITKWLTGLGVKQMIAALEKLKNDDERFDFNGLIWTTVDKL